MPANLNVLETSDEALLEMPDAAVAAPEKEPEAAASGAAQQETPAEGQERPQDEPEAPGGTQDTPAAQEQPAAQQETPAADPGGSQEAKPEEKREESAQETPPDLAKYKALWEQVMAPIKAGGKTIKLNSVEEVISLLQKGVDYTRKTMELGRYRKFGMMLEQADLLDEAKLDHLIAVAKGDKEALKKLLKDAKVDPVDIDTTTGDNYKPGAHAVTDDQAKLQDAVDDVRSDDNGEETLVFIRKTWDQGSKNILLKHPGVLNAIHLQRKSGVYAKISEEVEKQRVLGNVPAGMCFLDAYKMVGDKMFGPKPGSQGNPGGGTSASTKDPAAAGGQAPVTRRPASVPTGTTPGNPAARAAAATRTTPKSTPVVKNPMALSDEEFEKA